MKKMSLEEIILGSFGNAKNESNFFKEINGDTYVGYITATIRLMNPQIKEDIKEIYLIIKKLYSQGNL